MTGRRGLVLKHGLLAGAALLFGAPAVAQDGPGFNDMMSEMEPELYCVFDVLSQSDDYYGIADAWVAPDATDAEVNKADAVLTDAVKQCADKYAWDEETQKLGAAIGIHGSVVEVVTGDMLLEGVKQEEVQAVFDLFGVMDDADTMVFTNMDWMDDYDFKKKMYRALVKAGVPNKDAALEHSMFVLESSAVTTDTILKWISIKTADVADTPAKPQQPQGSRKSKSNKNSRAAPRAPKLELTATGTGWYVAPGGFLVTNAHVVDGCKMVTLKSGAQLDVLDVEVDEDLALLKGADSVSHLSLRDGRAARLAEDVLIAGYPLGGILSSGINVTVGTVSALLGMGDDDRRFQFTAPVQPGNSGGPVLDTSGHVIGVVVSKLNAMNIQQEVGDIPQNVNFGIAMKNLVAFLDQNAVPYERKVSNKPVDKVDLAELARESTVLLQCYQ